MRRVKHARKKNKQQQLKPRSVNVMKLKDKQIKQKQI